MIAVGGATFVLAKCADLKKAHSQHKDSKYDFNKGKRSARNIYMFSGWGLDTQKSKEIFDSSPKSEEIIDFDGSLKK